VLSQANLCLRAFLTTVSYSIKENRRGDLRLLASSPGVKTDHVTEAAEGAALPAYAGDKLPDFVGVGARSEHAVFLLVQGADRHARVRRLRSRRPHAGRLCCARSVAICKP